MIRFLLLALLVLGSGCAAGRIAQPETLPGFQGFAATSDGWNLSMFRVPPEGSGPHQGQPVILVHGTATNRSTFTLEGSDLATFLAEAGFDVWIAEMRGTRTSQPPDASTWSAGAWNVDVLAERDVPAILDHVAAATGRYDVMWVGHSLGGLLGYITLQGKHASRIKGLVTLGSPVRFAHGTDMVARVRALPGAQPRKGRLAMRSLANLSKGSLRLAPDGQLMHMLFNADNLGVDAAATFATEGTEDVAAGMLQQYGEWVDRGSFRSASGTDWLEGMSRVGTPLLVVAGTVDQLAPPWAVRPAWELAGGEDKTFLKLGRGWGQRNDYGHTDLLVGDWAFEEVFPTVRDWLVARAAPGAGAGGALSEP